MDALKLTFVNVGYGEAVLLECSDRTRPGGNFVMVIDGGSAEPMEYLHTQSGRIRLAEYLQSHVDHIDIMVNTHPHEDHVSGLCAAARLFPPQQLWQTLDGGFCRHTLHPLHVEAQNDAQRKCLKGLSDWQDLMGQVVLHGGAIRRLTAGDDVRIANGFTVRALAPDAKGTAALEQNLSSLMAAPAAARAEKLGRLDTALNNFSLILLVEYHGFRILLPGDTNAAGYGSIPGGSLQADLFKVGHHGQRDGADLALLQKVRPQAVICCASSDRRYGSADPGFLDMAAKQGAKVFCSDCPELPAGMPVPPPHHALVFRIWKDRKWDARYE